MNFYELLSKMSATCAGYALTNPARAGAFGACEHLDRSEQVL